MCRLALIVLSVFIMQSSAHQTPLLPWPQSTRLKLLLAVSLTLPMAPRNSTDSNVALQLEL